MSNKQNFKLGWKPDLPDHRDHLYSPGIKALNIVLPPRVDLRGPNMPPVYDQGRIGSCTANAIAGAVQFDRRKMGLTPDWVPSRLFVYYNERLTEHTVRTDAGAALRDGIKTIAARGVCSEDLWTYDDTPADQATSVWAKNAKPAKKPVADAYKAAADHQAISYQRISPVLAQMKTCLAEGFPFVFGITVFNSMWDNNGNPVVHLPMPQRTESSVGGHAVLCVGYDDTTQEFIVRNSWGPDVQDGGYFYIPYAYLTGNLAQDFWTVRSMEG